jgi:hypothetical protein
MLFGWDISTAIIGFAALDDSCSFLETRYCDLRKVDGELLDKADVAFNWIQSIANEYMQMSLEGKINLDHHCHYVEDRLSGFSGGGSNASTVMRLAAFNHSVSWMIWHWWGNPAGGVIDHLHPSTVKAIMKKDGLIIPKGTDKKKLTLDFVRCREPKFPVDLNRNDKPQPWCYDTADAFVTARAGYLRSCGKK